MEPTQKIDSGKRTERVSSEKMDILGVHVVWIFIKSMRYEVKSFKRKT